MPTGRTAAPGTGTRWAKPSATTTGRSSNASRTSGASSTSSADPWTDGETRHACSRGRPSPPGSHRSHPPPVSNHPPRPARFGPSEDPRTMADPLDKQLVEAVLSSRPRRTRRELEEAKLATMRPRRAGTAVAPPSADADVDADDDDDDDDDIDLTLEEGAEPPAELSIEVVTEEAVEGVAVP